VLFRSNLGLPLGENSMPVCLQRNLQKV